jgi:hypothetical protein
MANLKPQRNSKHDSEHKSAWRELTLQQCQRVACGSSTHAPDTEVSSLTFGGTKPPPSASE